MAAIKLLIILIVLMIILAKGKPLYAAAIVGTVLIGLFFWLPLGKWLSLVGRGAIASDTINILSTFFTIMLLEKYLDKHGFLQKMLTGLQQGFSNRRVVMGCLPALIGLIPSAGGALFSAPMLEQASKGLDLTGEQKTLINFYFRHVFEMYLPIYPAVIILAQLTKIPFSHIFLAVLPMAIVHIALGIPYLKVIPKAKPTKKLAWSARKKVLLDLLTGTGPILIVLLLILIFNLKIWLAVLIVLVPMLIYTKDYRPAVFKKLFKEAIQWENLFVVLTLMIFKDMLMQSGALSTLPALMAHLPIPFFLVIAGFAFFINMLTGMGLATLSICLPIAIITSGGTISLAMTVLINVTAFAGAIVTPMHLCLPISSQYFKAGLDKLIPKLLPPALILATTAIFYYLLLVHLGV